MIQEIINENEFLKDENQRLTKEMTEYYFLNVAKANLLDILMETGFIKHSHIEYGLKELDPIDRNLLEKEWSDDNDSNN
ncbi:hypothetical protein [Streptococcus uberis]|uniref:hypothetical protein n=1 Tax=Streptococcus uberis TaxID=1349 RepID=UPI00062026AE|nr:hypothetical protein [Streptococcus uberis]KKF47159.1 hypothetical protein AF62_08320 [Streptococcus uberis C8329]KKF59239.1 hypothetical protein AF58_00660 [Streptococcus uberis C6344]QBX22047.1 hypothetical protein Javan629_0045 [Streptococcus phage Javan629]